MTENDPGFAMYHAHFKAINLELCGASNDTLAEIAGNGGWRKSILDSGKATPASIFDIVTRLSFLCSLIIEILPPVGAGFRRALVAQFILDQKAVAW